ncbi:MAG: hypothetical protein Q8R02_18575 [Hyphomonadaceae bacterium]|nr:hypothetical protein [Hyphomonadaceae bacterium]
MTQADHIAKDDVKLELSQLWMLPLILFRMICSFFQTEQKFIRDHRRKGVAPKDWEDHIPDLVEAEWAIDAIKAEGARRLLAGEHIDFNTIRIPAPPDDWQPLVHDAADLMRRFEAVASFHADPEKFIRRHAARISDLARESIVRTPAWFDRRPFGPAHHEGSSTSRLSRSPHGGEQLALTQSAQAPVESRGRLAPAALHVHTHPP